MVDVDKAVIARLKKSEQVFEILVDCDKAIDYKQGKEIDLSDVLATNIVYKDVKKVQSASENEINNIFGTSEIKEVADFIIKNGEIQLTKEHKDKLRKAKLKQIIETIHKNAINPQTGHPHPPQRIEDAIKQAKVRIDEFKRVEEQVQEVLAGIRPILPIKFEIREIKVKIPAQYGVKSFYILKNFGKVLKEEWLNDGSLSAMIELPAGMQESFENELNKLTQGNAEIEITKKK